MGCSHPAFFVPRIKPAPKDDRSLPEKIIVMEPLITCLFASIFCLLIIPLVPNAIANSHPETMRRWVTALVGANFLLAVGLFATHLLTGGVTSTVRLIELPHLPGANLGIRYDGAASLMLLLVTFVGFVVSRFSIRYLNGERTQGRYFRWIGFSIGAVSLMVVAGNLLLFFAAWVITSLGLHQLLLHYHHRPAARHAAWTKFAISRLGDAFLIAALVLIDRVFETFELSELYARIEDLGADPLVTPSQMAIPWLLMLGAITKSAQFPFHVWLPDTMETPTPVSALMHAGVVNAGGYLIIRTSPLMALAPGALLTLASIGAFTACFAGIVMMTQPSVKRALAYSTIAQMGFMMLQCGLGAYSAAMLHIIVHSLYKAHAFLASGSVVSQSRAISAAAWAGVTRAANLRALFAASVMTVIAGFATLVALGVDLRDKPGGFLLASILGLALTSWGWRLLTLGDRRAALVGLAGVAGLCLAYVASYIAVDQMLASTVSAIRVTPAPPFVLVGIGAAFALLFALSAVLTRRRLPPWLVAFRVHAVNGFYVHAVYHRVFASLGSS